MLHKFVVKFGKLVQTEYFFYNVRKMSIHAKEITYESGNITLASAVGAHLYRMENCSFSEADNRMDKLAEKLISEGKKPYIIPRGGSSAASIWGYIECWQEMERQGSYQY